MASATALTRDVARDERTGGLMLGRRDGRAHVARRDRRPADGQPRRPGIEPREIEGLTGIPLAPFLHGGFGHLIGNTCRSSSSARSSR
jgi:hypothetical protein